MFIAIYQFEVFPGKEEPFKESWRALTELILKYEDSLGSRLHQENNQIYIAYAQWDSREQWENSGGNLPESANEYRQLMRAACSEITTIHELEMVDDLLIKPK